MSYLLIAAFLLYVGICAVLWAQQDRMVFPGAGRGDRGVPNLSPPAVVAWLGEGDQRIRMATVSAPRPAAVVLYFGGNGEDLYAAAANAAALAAYGVEAIGVEYPGYGASPGRPSEAGLAATAAAAIGHAKARALALRLPLAVVGSSLGSYCALQAAATGGVARLVLRAPPTSLPAVARGQFGWLPVGLLLAHRFDNLALAPRVRCPVLVVHGDADTIVPDRFGRELANALPQAEFVPVPGCGHNDLDLSPAGPVAATLRGFLVGR